jgi:exostosin family protein
LTPIKIYFAGIPAGAHCRLDLGRALRVNGSEPAMWGEGPDSRKYDRLNREAPLWFQSTALDDAEIVVYGDVASNSPAVTEASLAAKSRGLPCLFFSWGDEDVPISVPHGIVYRHSLFSDRRLACERASPAFCADPQEHSGRTLSAREKEDRPSVGFCGFVSNPLLRAVYRLTGRQRKVEGLALRARALRALGKTPGIQTDFICRNLYWAGTSSRFHHDPAAQEQSRKLFLDNVMNTDYTLCARGAGNFSYRFYEVLAAQRIPIFVNTRCVLPFDDEIDWRRHCVWVEEDQIHDMGPILAEFHAKLSPEQFRAMQISNRRLWEERLSPLAFYKHALGRLLGRTSADAPAIPTSQVGSGS